MNRLEQRRNARAAAMPEVKRLIKKYGHGAVTGCLLKIREMRKREKKVQELRKELVELSRKQ